MSRAGTPQAARKADAAGIGVGAAAQRVGLAAATLRAWERRYGIGPTGRTAGGHRRYTAADIAALQRLRRLVGDGMPTASAAAAVTATATAGASPTRHPLRVGRGVVGFAAAADALDPHGLARCTRDLLAAQGTVAAWTEVFAPYLQALGQRWERAGTCVEREHLTVAVLQAALRAHAFRGRDPGRPPSVMLAATELEQHTLPLDALHAAAAEIGVATAVLGNLPTASLHAVMDDTAATIVILWARSTATSDTRQLRSLTATTPMVWAAGPGWRPRKLPAGVGLLTDLPGALATLQAWSP